MDSLVIFTAVDGALKDPDGSRWSAGLRPAVQQLLASAIPVVFISDRKAPEVIALERDLDMRHPFIAAGGAELYVPRGYFPEVLDTTSEGSEWELLRLQARGDSGDAVRLLMALYCFGDDPVLFVGLGEDWKDRVLLRAVDVPVIVRNDAVDQARLLRRIPDAYLTSAAGSAGWIEAIFGPAAE